MGTLGNIVGNAVDAGFGKSKGTSLQDFLSHFSSSEGKWVNVIDPFSTFDVRIRFYPPMPTEPVKPSTNDKELLDKLEDIGKAVGNSLVSSAKSAVKNAANNLTGGLLGSIMNSEVDIMKKHDDNWHPVMGTHTFLEYLAAANLLVGKEDWFGESAGQSISPLELQLGLYCQEAVIPNIEVPSGGTSTVNGFGEFPINGLFVKPDSNVITLKIINTKVPLHERIFYPWMREVTLPYWSYACQPYTTATITIDFTKHNDIQYVFCGCRPQKISMQQPTQEASSPNLIRDVYFIFDYMFINSTLTNTESLTDKLLSTGKTLFNGAAKMLNA